MANARVNKSTCGVTGGQGKGKGKRARSPPPNPSPLKSRRRSPRVRVQPAQDPGPSPKGTGGRSAEDNARVVKTKDVSAEDKADLRDIMAAIQAAERELREECECGPGPC